MIFKEKFLQAKSFFQHDLWKIETKNLPTAKRWLYKNLKIFIQSGKNFIETDGTIRASALTLFTLLSIVPVIAMLFGVAKGFGLQQKMEAALRVQFPDQQPLLDKVFEFSRSWLENTQGGLVAGIGVIFLLYTIVRVIGNIEETFNQIWGVNKQRPWARKFSDYLSLMLIGPFLGVTASSLSVFLSSQVNKFTDETFISTFADIATSILMRLGPFVIIWFLFSFTFIFLPNTKVKIISGIYGGIIAGTIYQIVQIVYISLQVGVSRAGAIYGSFAALPLFIIWLQISWNIVLFGSQLSYCYQTFEANEKKETTPRLSFYAVKRISLRILNVISRRFMRGLDPLNAEKLASETELPLRVVKLILDKLLCTKLLVEIRPQDEEAEGAFQPQSDPTQLKIIEVIQKIEAYGDGNDLAEYAKDSSHLYSALEEIQHSLRQHPENHDIAFFGEPKAS